MSEPEYIYTSLPKNWVFFLGKTPCHFNFRGGQGAFPQDVYIYRALIGWITDALLFVDLDTHKLKMAMKLFGALCPLFVALAAILSQHCDAVVDVQYTTVTGKPCRPGSDCVSSEGGYWCRDGSGRSLGYNPLSWDYCSPSPGLTYRGEGCLNDCTKHGDYFKCTISGNTVQKCSNIYKFTYMQTVDGHSCRQYCNQKDDNGNYWCYYVGGVVSNWGYCSPSPGLSITGKRCATGSCGATGHCNTEAGREQCTVKDTSRGEISHPFSDICEYRPYGNRQPELAGPAPHGNQGTVHDELRLKRDVAAEDRASEGTDEGSIPKLNKETARKSRSKRLLHQSFVDKHVLVNDTSSARDAERNEMQRTPTTWMRRHIPPNVRLQENRRLHSVILLTPDELFAIQEWSNRTVTDQTRIWTDRFYWVVTFRRRGSADIWSIDTRESHRPARRRVCVQSFRPEDRQVNHFCGVSEETEPSTDTSLEIITKADAERRCVPPP